jgi:hypothetical protein
MIFVKAEEIPLTIVEKVLVVVERVLELIIDEVPIDPPRLEVKVLAEDERVLATFKLVTLRLVVVALVAKRLEILPVTELSNVAKNEVVVALVAVRLLVTVLLATSKLVLVVTELIILNTLVPVEFTSPPRYGVVDPVLVDPT